DKQGKHIVGHKNYKADKSQLTHADPQKLVNKYAGSGQRINNEIPGSPGYRERVDFAEVIGLYKDETTKITRETTMGMLVYAKDGVHIVPLRPKGLL
ncbi:MAG: polymorphic toxin type 50 domain-containing protein, partial [Chlamydiales bacterium]